MTQLSTLESLPVELLQAIGESCDTLTALRATCRKIAHALYIPFKTQYLTVRPHLFTVPSLETLVEITLNPEYVKHVQEIILAPVAAISRKEYLDPDTEDNGPGALAKRLLPLQAQLEALHESNGAGAFSLLVKVFEQIRSAHGTIKIFVATGEHANPAYGWSDFNQRMREGCKDELQLIGTDGTDPMVALAKAGEIVAAPIRDLRLSISNHCCLRGTEEECTMRVDKFGSEDMDLKTDMPELKSLTLEVQENFAYAAERNA